MMLITDVGGRTPHEHADDWLTIQLILSDPDRAMSHFLPFRPATDAVRIGQ